MNKKFVVAAFAAALLVTAACSSAPPPKNTTPPAKAPPPGNTSNLPNKGAADSGAQPAQQSKQDFTLVNETGVEIHALYISPHDVDDWQEDILGRDTLPDGERVNITFHRSEKAAMWDLRVEDKGGHAIEWENLNLLTISKITLHYENNKATAQVE